MTNFFFSAKKEIYLSAPKTFFDPTKPVIFVFFFCSVTFLALILGFFVKTVF